MSTNGCNGLAAFQNEIIPFWVEPWPGAIAFVFWTVPTTCRPGRIEIVERLDIDPTEDSNAVCWGNN